MGILDWLAQPETREIEDLDDASTASIHARIIRSKGFLRRLYTDFYQHMRDEGRYEDSQVFVEVGSGGGFVKEVMPGVFTSDVVPQEGVDWVFSAELMPFRADSVSGIFMFNSFHHFKDPAAALGEFQRVLKIGGTIVMIEPANTPFARLVYNHLHHEPFDPAAGWSVHSSGRLSDANGALPWIVFSRDYELFVRRFPDLRLVSLTYHTPFSYLVSGGLSWRQLVPTWSFLSFRFVEKLLAPVARWLGMFMTLEVIKVHVDR